LGFLLAILGFFWLVALGRFFGGSVCREPGLLLLANDVDDFALVVAVCYYGWTGGECLVEF
jgi:hypothetical protein